jgi:23S rRNA U2552 (ribose-2'-O)-methylase RlmE/FtsJ
VQGIKKIVELNVVPGGFLERSNQLIEKKKRLTQVSTISALSFHPVKAAPVQAVVIFMQMFVRSKKKNENKRKPVLCLR